MPQFSKLYVKIVNQPFIPMNLPVGFVWQVNDVVARYVISTGAAILTNSAGVPVDPQWRPQYLGAKIDNAAPTLVQISYDQTMVVTDDTGFTVEVEGSPVVIVSAVANGNDIDLTIPAVSAGESVTFSYDSETGNAEDTNGNPPVSQTDEVVINEVE